MSRTCISQKNSKQKRLFSSIGERSQQRVNDYLDNFLTLPKTDYTYADTGSYHTHYVGRDYEVPNMTRQPLPADHSFRNTSSIRCTPDTSPMRLRSGSVVHGTPSLHNISLLSLSPPSSKDKLSHPKNRATLISHNVAAFFSWWAMLIRLVKRWCSPQRINGTAHTNAADTTSTTVVSSMYGLDVEETSETASHHTEETTTLTKIVMTIIETITHPIENLYVPLWNYTTTLTMTQESHNSQDKTGLKGCLPCCCLCFIIPLILALLLSLMSLFAGPPVVSNNTTSAHIDMVITSAVEKQLKTLIDRMIDPHLIVIRQDITNLNMFTQPTQNPDKTLTRQDMEIMIEMAIAKYDKSMTKEIDSVRRMTKNIEAMNEASISVIINSILSDKLAIMRESMLVGVKQRLDQQVATNKKQCQSDVSELELKLNGMLASIELLTKDLEESRQNMKILGEHQSVMTKMRENEIWNSEQVNTVIDENQKSTKEKILSILREEIKTLRFEKIQSIVDSALLIFSADKTGMADFALESAGGSVVSTLCSNTYSHKTALISVWGLPLFYQSYSPRTVIQAGMNPGECWAFKGSTGHLVIKLATMIRPTMFTLEHIPQSLVTGSINSAPKDITVFGMVNEDYKSKIYLGNYTYSIDHPNPMQNFLVQAIDPPDIDFVWLTVKNNYGNIEYTCLYRFRVHGIPPHKQ